MESNLATAEELALRERQRAYIEEQRQEIGKGSLEEQWGPAASAKAVAPIRVEISFGKIVWGVFLGNVLFAALCGILYLVNGAH